MSSAQIVITQSGVKGAAGLSRPDIVTGQPVTLSNSNDADVRSWRWVLELPSGSAAALSNPVTPQSTFTPDVAGTYVVTLTVDEGNTGQTQRRLVAVRNAPVVIGPDTYNTRYIGKGEDAEANWDSVYNPGTPNDDGWWEALDVWLHMLQAVATSGGGGGEVNTASNFGPASGLFDAKVGTDLQFKTLGSSSGLTLSTTDLGGAGKILDFVVSEVGAAAFNGVMYTWPASDAAGAGYVLTSDGAGTLSWVAAGGGGGGETLAQTLVLGNNTGGTWVIVDVPDAIEWASTPGSQTFTTGRVATFEAAGTGAIVNVPEPLWTTNASTSLGDLVRVHIEGTIGVLNGATIHDFLDFDLVQVWDMQGSGASVVVRTDNAVGAAALAVGDDYHIALGLATSGSIDDLHVTIDSGDNAYDVTLSLKATVSGVSGPPPA